MLIKCSFCCDIVFVAAVVYSKTSTTTAMELCLSICCCSYGVFSPVETADVPRLVSRLARNQLLLVHPSEPSRRSEHVNALLPRIHQYLIHSCISSTLPTLLHTYCDFWRYLCYCFCALTMLCFCSELNDVTGPVLVPVIIEIV